MAVSTLHEEMDIFYLGEVYVDDIILARKYKALSIIVQMKSA